MPLIVILLIIVLILFLLSMIFYFISGAIGNFTGFRNTNTAEKEESGKFSYPLFQNDTKKEPETTSNTESTINGRSNTTSNTSTTKTAETTHDQTTNNNTTQTDNNGNFLGETMDTTQSTVDETVPTGIFDPVITGVVGTVNNLFGQ